MRTIKKTVWSSVLAIFLVVAVAVSSVQAITIQAEEKLAKEFLKVVHQQYEIVQDPLIEAYVNRVGNRVLAGFLPQPFQYHFAVIKQDVYNAFAGPGGYVFINSGLLAALDNENELAGILAHEISHVVCRHISKNIDRAGKIEMATLAGVVAGIFLGAAGGGSAASALTVGSMAAGQSAFLAFSRDDERQADKTGLPKLYEAGYTADGLLAALRKIRSKEWYGSNEVPSYLTTHPGTEERIGYISEWIADHDPGVKPHYGGDFEFDRIRTRLRALYTDQDLALRQFAAQTREKPNSFFSHYGYALALVRAGHYNQAIGEYKKALELRAFDPYLPIDMGEAYFLAGRYEAALKLLSNTAPAEIDASRQLYLGRTQMEMGRIRTALGTFKQLVATNPRYAEGLYNLGEAYGKLNILDEAHYNLGLYYKEKGMRQKAVFNLKRALAKASNDEIRARIQKALDSLGEKKKHRHKKKKPQGS
jgi:predicted Zn-dependent protease